MWKEIKDFPSYEVSNKGDIRKKNKTKLMKAYLSHNGYLGIKLINNNGRIGIRVHRLVAQAFIPNPNNKPFINHIDGNKLNNHIDNLEWVTVAENNQHAYDTGLKSQDSNKALSKDEVLYIRSNFKNGCRLNGGNALGRKFGVSKTTILNALKSTY